MIKRYRANNGDLHFIEETVNPDSTWVEEEFDENATPDPNYKVPYTALRQAAYPYFGDQLGALYDDILAGKFGELAKDSSWFNTIKSIKESIPK